MKVQSPTIAPAAPLTYGRLARPAATAAPSRAVSIDSSPFLAELGAAARANPHGEIRADVVAQAKADIASGRLGSAEDIERTIDRFLMELG